MTDLVVTQTGAEIAFVGNPNLVVTQMGVEVAYSLVPALVITQMGVEVAWDRSAIASSSVFDPFVMVNT